MKPLLVLLLGVSFAAAAPVPKAKKVVPLPGEVVKAWTDAGATIVWRWKTESGEWCRGDKPNDSTNAYPLILLKEVPDLDANLPPVGQPYGLWLEKNDFPADWALHFPEPDRVIHLRLEQGSPRAAVRLGNNAVCREPDYAVVDDDLEQAKRFTALESMELENNSHITDNGMAHLKALKNLRYLDISTTEIGDEGLRHLRELTGLEWVVLNDTLVTEAGLEYFAASKKLSRLTMHLPVTAVGVGHLKRLKGLRHLDIRAGQNESVDGVLAGCEGMPNLARLDLRTAKLTRSGISRLKALKQLECLDLSSSNITDEGLADIAGLESLTELRLGSTALTDAGMKHLAGLKRLKYLDAADVKLGRDGVAWIGQLQNLEVLYLSGCGINTSSMESVGKLGRLKTLHLSCCPIGDAGLARLKSLHRLELLYLGDAWISDKGLQTLAGMPELRSLSLPNNLIDGHGMKSLAGLTKLQSLSLSGNKVTDAGLLPLAELPKLETLNLRGSKVSDTGLSTLRRFSKLVELDLSCAEITVKGLDTLKEFKTLTLLYLHDYEFDKAAFKELRAAMPKCSVICNCSGTPGDTENE